METDKKQLIKVVCTCLLGTLMFGGVGAYLFFGNDPSVDQNEKILYSAIAGFLMLLCIATAALFIFSYKKKQAPEDGKTDDDIKRESAIHKKLPGKDMYEVIRLYRRRNYQTRIIAISIACVLIVFMFLIKMCGDYGMDYRIAIALGVLTIILSFVVCGRKEFSYSKELDFKKAIAESGADPVRLNADFMIGSHFTLPDGLVVLGRDYIVIFAKSLNDINDLTVSCIRAILLESKAHNDNVGAKHLNTFFQHQLDGLVCHVCTHTVVHASPCEDNLRIVAKTLGTLGQIVGIDTDTVTTYETRIHVDEVPLSACCFKHRKSINSHPVKDY